MGDVSRPATESETTISSGRSRDDGGEERPKKKKGAMEGGSRIRKRSEDDGAKGRHERMQPPRPNVDEGIIYRRIEQRWDFKEMNEKVVPMWCRGTIVAAKRNSRVHI